MRKLVEWAQPSHHFVSGAINILGFPFDGTACYRKGTRLGPSAIAEAIENIETYSPDFDIDLSSTKDLFDLGDIPFIGENEDQKILHADEVFNSKLEGLKKDDGSFYIGLGGEHSISYLPLKKYLSLYDDLVIIQLDAHADLRDGYEGFHYSHASVMRRSFDHFSPGHELIQHGIRSGTQEEFLLMKERKSFEKEKESFLRRVDLLTKTRPVFVTLDLDYFDPAYLPGTGTPEPNGAHYRDFFELVEILQTKNWVGFDMVELSPELDPTGCSDVFAAIVLREVVSSQMKKRARP